MYEGVTKVNDDTSEPLHIRAVDERGRRGWSQKDAAKAAGMSLRAYQEFESGRSDPQNKNLRGILRAFGFDGTSSGDRASEQLHVRVGQMCPTCHRPVFPKEVEAFRNMIGAYLLTLDENDREARIFEETRRIFEVDRNTM